MLVIGGHAAIALHRIPGLTPAMQAGEAGSKGKEALTVSLMCSTPPCLWVYCLASAFEASGMYKATLQAGPLAACHVMRLCSVPWLTLTCAGALHLRDKVQTARWRLGRWHARGFAVPHSLGGSGGGCKLQQVRALGTPLATRLKPCEQCHGPVSITWWWCGVCRQDTPCWVLKALCACLGRVVQKIPDH